MEAKLEGVSELVLEVTDLEAATRFYTEVLGMPVIERWEGERRAVWVQAGPTRIGLWMPQVGIAKGRGGVHVHYAVRVSDQGYDQLLDHLRALDQEFGEVRWGGGARSLYVTDPDQHVVELWTHDIRAGSAGGAVAATPGLFGMEGLPPLPS